MPKRNFVIDETGPRVSHERRERNGQIEQPLPSFIRYQRGPESRGRGLTTLPFCKSSVRSRDERWCTLACKQDHSLDYGSPVRWMEANRTADAQQSAFRQPREDLDVTPDLGRATWRPVRRKKACLAVFCWPGNAAWAVQLDPCRQPGDNYLSGFLDNGSQGKSYRGLATLLTTRSRHVPFVARFWKLVNFSPKLFPRERRGGSIATVCYSRTHRLASRASEFTSRFQNDGSLRRQWAIASISVCVRTGENNDGARSRSSWQAKKEIEVRGGLMVDSGGRVTNLAVEGDLLRFHYRKWKIKFPR